MRNIISEPSKFILINNIKKINLIENICDQVICNITSKNIHEELYEFNNIQNALEFYNTWSRYVTMHFIRKDSIFLVDFNTNLLKINNLLQKNTEVVEKFNKIGLEHKQDMNINLSYTEYISEINRLNKNKYLYSKEDSQKLYSLIKNNNNILLYKTVIDMATCAHSNTYLQSLIGEMDERNLEEFIHFIGHKIAILAGTKHGAYVVQKLINTVKTTKNKELLAHYFSTNTVNAAIHEISNYSLQMLLNFNHPDINKQISENITEISNNSIGRKVLQKIKHIL